MLVSNGGDVYEENSSGKSPLCLVTDAAVIADMLFLTRRPLLFFLKAVCVAKDLTNTRSLLRVAESSDLAREIVMFT